METLLSEMICLYTVFLPHSLLISFFRFDEILLHLRLQLSKGNIFEVAEKSETDGAN